VVFPGWRLAPLAIICIHTTLADRVDDRSSGQPLQVKKHPRKVRDLRHCGDLSTHEFP
jgi:hypothetical protein